jgi:hypothetical protein
MPQFRMAAMTRWLNQMVRPPVAPIIFSNTATDYLQAIVGPLIGKDAPKSQEEPLYVVKRLVPAGKTLRAEDASYTSGSSPGEGHY